MLSKLNDYPFAFTILDDTDDGTYENIKPVYDFLMEKGLRTTKTVWPMDYPDGHSMFFPAESLTDNPAYLEYVQDLEVAGFEIASHGATMESSYRDRTMQGLDYLAEKFSNPPRLYCNHATNRENLYWGYKRFNTFPFRQVIKLHEKYSSRVSYNGDNPESELFWGDLALQTYEYVRSFTFRDLNMLNYMPSPLYRLRETPWVKNWFITADAPDAEAYGKIVNPKSIDKLAAEGGICILSTHLGKGFYRDGKLDASFVSSIEHLVSLKGWFVPVSELLDCIHSKAPTQVLGKSGLAMLEARYIVDKLSGRFSDA